jgi:hypothetical protein
MLNLSKSCVCVYVYVCLCMYVLCMYTHARARTHKFHVCSAITSVLNVSVLNRILRLQEQQTYVSMTRAARSLADGQYDRRCFPYRCVRHTVTERFILHPSIHLALSVSGGAAEPGSALP